MRRTAQHDGLTEPRPHFAELTGAYWLEPIYAGLAHEWDRQGRTVPGSAPHEREQWRVLPDGTAQPGGRGAREVREVREVPPARDVRDARTERVEPRQSGGPDAWDEPEDGEEPGAPGGRQRPALEG